MQTLCDNVTFLQLKSFHPLFRSFGLFSNILPLLSNEQVARLHTIVLSLSTSLSFLLPFLFLFPCVSLSVLVSVSLELFFFDSLVSISLSLVRSRLPLPYPSISFLVSLPSLTCSFLFCFPLISSRLIPFSHSLIVTQLSLCFLSPFDFSLCLSSPLLFCPSISVLLSLPPCLALCLPSVFLPSIFHPLGLSPRLSLCLHRSVSPPVCRPLVYLLIVCSLSPTVSPHLTPVVSQSPICLFNFFSPFDSPPLSQPPPHVLMF